MKAEMERVGRAWRETGSPILRRYYRWRFMRMARRLSAVIDTASEFGVLAK